MDASTGDEAPEFPDPLERDLVSSPKADSSDGRIDPRDWAGGVPQHPAHAPSIRMGQRWVSGLWLIPIGIVALVLGIAVAQQMRTYQWMQNFLREYPGTSPDYVPSVSTGFPWWLRWQHFFNIIFMMFIIRAGLQILADHPRLYVNSGSRPGTEWLRLRGAVPADRMDPDKAHEVWTAKDDSVALPKWLGIPGYATQLDWPAGGISASISSG